MMSSGREEMRAERMNHCLPARKGSKYEPGQDACTLVDTFSSKNLGNAILLVQEPLLVDFVE